MIYKRIRWINKHNKASPPVMEDIIIFDRICIGEHFKGYDRGGFRFELHFRKSFYCFDFKRGLSSLKGIYSKNDYHLTLRWNKPILSFYPLKMDIKNYYRLVERV